MPPPTKNIVPKLLPWAVRASQPPAVKIPLTARATAIAENAADNKEKAGDLVYIKDPRKIRRTTGQPLKATERRGGQVPKDLITEITGYAKKYNINPNEAIARAIIESEGNPSYNNPFHILLDSEVNPHGSKIMDSYASGVEAGLVFVKQKENEFNKLVKKGKISSEKRDLLRLQIYNGLGKLFPSTEGAQGWMYGVKIPKEGLKMTDNPLYAKELLDIVDIVKANPEIQNIVKSTQPTKTTTQYGPLKNRVYSEVEEFGKGGLIKRKDGSYSKRGLWDNIRANRGSGRRPTKEMLRQERKIRAAEKKEDGGQVAHDYMYNNGNVSSFYPGTSVHPYGVTNVPDSPCGPGFTVQYDETGNPVCVPIVQPGNTAGVNTPVLASFDVTPQFFNSDVYRQTPLETFEVSREVRPGRIKEKAVREERVKLPKEKSSARQKALRASDINKKPLGYYLRRFGKTVGDAIERCLPGDDCYKFEEGGPVYNWIPEYPRVGARNEQGGWLDQYEYGGSIEDQRIPTPAQYEFGLKYADNNSPTLTTNQMGTPRAYAHGATVFTKQTTPAWVAGTPTPTTTQREIAFNRSFSPGTAVPYPEVKIPASAYTPASPPVLQGYNPYNGPMRLHAPDTTQIARHGGRVTEKYKKRAGIPYAISPGVSNAGMYVGPTTQRGITFANGGWLDTYATGEEETQAGPTVSAAAQLATKPYFSPAVVQSVLAKANQPVTTTTGRVISTPETREKERREKIIAKNPSKYNIEDYKKGIQEPQTEYVPIEAILLPSTPYIKGLGKLGNVLVDAANPLSGVGKKPVVKAATPDPFGIADEIVPSLDPIKIMGIEGSIMDLSPLNLIPGYGKTLKGSSKAYRKFGNTMQDVIERQALSPKGGSSLRMGREQIVSEGNWAALKRPSENYSGTYAAEVDFNKPGTNIGYAVYPNRNGVLLTDASKNTLTEIPLTDPGLQFYRRLPFSTRYVPINKEKLINKEFQLATQGGYLQSLLEKYGMGLGAAATLEGMGREGTIDQYNKYTVDPIINWANEQYSNQNNTSLKKKNGGWLDNL